MRKLIFTLASLLTLCGGMAAHTFHVAEHGTLEQMVTDYMSDPNLPDDEFTITELIVTGEIDNKDLAYIHAAAGLMQNVQKLDLSGVTIIPTNGYYAKVEYNPNNLYYPDYKYLYFDDTPSQASGEFMTASNVQKNYHIHSNDLAFMFQGMTKLREVKLPDQVKSYGEYIFDGCTSLETVTANGADLSTVGERAFYNCSKLNMTISTPITNLGKMAFYNCSGFSGDLVVNNIKEIPEKAFYKNAFTSITINSPYLETIGISAFESSSSLQTLDLSGCTNLTSIGLTAFRYCSNLSNVTFPNALTSIEDGAFGSCSALTNYTLPESVIHLGKGALPFKRTKKENGFWIQDNILYHYEYSGNADITELNIPEGVRIIVDDALGGIYNCKNLTSVSLPDGLRSIGKFSFYNNSQLESIKIPNTVEYIGVCAFQGCTSLTGVILPQKLKYLGSEAFLYCTSLSAITIPESVEIIDGAVFKNCTGLWRVTYKATNAKNPSGQFAFSGCSGITIFNWGTAAIKSIPANLCNGLSCVTSVPSTVETIGAYAFRSCTGLTSVTLSNDATVIGDYAFCGCSNLSSISLGNSLQSIGEAAFGSTQINSFTLPATVNSLGHSALNSGNSVTVNISDMDAWRNITFGGNPAYYDLILNGQPVTDIVIPEGVTEIKPYVFNGVKGIASVTLPSTFKQIGKNAFLGINCPFHICDIAAWCDIDFNGYNPANKLYLNGELATDIVIPEGVTQIKPIAFKNNKGIKKCTLPSTMETIGTEAFSGSSLESIEMNEGLKRIENYAFYEIYPKQGEPIIIPSTINYIGKEALSIYVKISVGGTPPKYPYFIFEGENVPEIGYNPCPTQSTFVYYVPSNSIKEYYNAFKTNVHGFQKFTLGKANSFCSVYDGEFSEDVKVYTFSHIQDGVVYGKLVENNSVEAGKPYIIVPTEANERYAFDPFSLAGDPLTAGLADDNNAMQGVLADDCDEDVNYKTVAGSDYIVFTTEGLRLANSKGTKIKAGKCYINHDNAFAAPAGVRAVALGRYLDADLTGVESVSDCQTEQGYTINGTKSDGKGLVIYKGRKVLNKKL